jgi:hypothetical protein
MHNTSPAHTKARAVFQVLVIYEDFAASRQATSTCNLLMNKLGDEFELRCSMWKFEVLRNESLRQMAAVEATEADAIIVATRGGSALPEEITHWVDGWISLRGDHPAALIALVDAGFQNTNKASGVHDYLQSVAAAAKMDFLPQVSSFTMNESRMAGLAPQMDALSRDTSWSTSERHWGINE